MAQKAQIEVVSINDAGYEARIAALTENILANREPGFQIDGVKEVDELEFVFNLLLRSMPNSVRSKFRFNNVQPTFGDYGWLREAFGTPPHTDEDLAGIGVHYNVVGRPPLTLGLVDHEVPEVNLPPSEFDSIFDADFVQHVRTGFSAPGRLTVISHGGFDNLYATLHFFDRRNGNLTEQEWISYAYSPDSTKPEVSWRDIVMLTILALERFNMTVGGTPDASYF